MLYLGAVGVISVGGFFVSLVFFLIIGGVFGVISFLSYRSYGRLYVNVHGESQKGVESTDTIEASFEQKELPEKDLV